MNKDNAKEYLPLVQALADGKTVQLNQGSRNHPDWQDADNLNFSDDIECYRIKPEPKLRPWKAEEVPVGVLLHKNVISDFVACEMITQKDSSGKVPLSNGKGGTAWKSTKEMLEEYTYSTDNGKTWKPCGVEE